MSLASISLSSDAVSALITMGVTIVIALVVDRLVIGRGGRVAARIGDGGVSRTAQTRLRVVRRLLFVTILLIGGALALSRFQNFNRLATGLLASSAVLTLIIGLAARQVIANPMAGLLLAIAQPIRIGDSVTIEDETGRVDDLTLSYTYVDTLDGRQNGASGGIGVAAAGRRSGARAIGARRRRHHDVRGRRDHLRGSDDRGPRPPRPRTHEDGGRGGEAPRARARGASDGWSARLGGGPTLSGGYPLTAP